MKIARVSPARKPRAITVLIAAGLLTIVLPASLAAASPQSAARRAGGPALPYGVSRPDYALMMAQLPLAKAATQIQIAAAKPGPGHAGFFETEMSGASHTLTVRWHGTVPADIIRLISTLRGKVGIRIAPARYSLATLTWDIHRALRQPGALDGYPLSDGSGIHIDVRAARMRTAVPAIRAAIGVPVSVTAGGGEQLQATCTAAPGDTAGVGHRCYDAPAFWGGDVIQGVVGNNLNECTGGFGVHDTSGRLYMMTAAHCAEVSANNYQNGIWFYNGNFTYALGQITDVPGPLDAALIPADTGRYYYDGPGIFNGDTSFTKAVVGQLDPSKGESLCESGAFGGVICGMTVQSLGFTDGPWNSMALTSSTTGRYSVGGDSGGPWFSLAGSASVYAIGIHHGITTNIFGSPTGEVFTPIVPVSSALGVYVNS